MKVKVDKTGVQGAWKFTTPKKRGGRPKITDRRASEAHRVRPPLRADRPVHVTMRMVKSIRTMRTRNVYNANRKAMALAAVTRRIRIVHFSIQRDHLHAIVETDDRDELARGMQGFQISAARQINRVCERDGQCSRIAIRQEVTRVEAAESRHFHFRLRFTTHDSSASAILGLCHRLRSARCLAAILDGYSR